MVFVWIWQSVIWLVKLPFFLLPDSSFLPVPSVIRSAVETAGEYVRWVIYLAGDSVGDAVVLVLNFALPLLIVVWLWSMLAKLLKTFGLGILLGRVAEKLRT